MTVHTTPSGYVEFFASWRAGENRPVDLAGDVLVTDDGDGNCQAWHFTGDPREAMVVLGSLESKLDDDYVVQMDGSERGYSLVRTPDDFWIEKGDEVIANTEKYPDVIVW